MKRRLLFLMCCLFAIAQGTWAQTEYITDVMVIGCDKQEDVNAKWDAVDHLRQERN